MKYFLILVAAFFVLIPLNSVAQLTIKLMTIPESTPANSCIYISGDFNNWNPADEKYILEPQKDGTYEIQIKAKTEKIAFKFTLGSWEKVECSMDGSDIQNRDTKVNQKDTVYLTVRAWKNDIKKTSRMSNVHIVKKDFYMPQFNRNRRIWIYLPPDYKESKKNYPVLYMHDGQNLFDDITSYVGEWGIDESLNKLFEENGKGVIVVGIDHGDSLRGEELTPWENKKYGGGKGPIYAKFIVETLKPYIDKNYRTLSDRESTGVMGSSFGGINTFYMGLAHHDVFSKVGVFSPSFWYSNECYKMAEDFVKRVDIKMFILAGGKEYAKLEEQVRKMEKIFRKNGFTEDELKVKFVPAGKHSEVFWRKEFPEAFQWLFHNN